MKIEKLSENQIRCTLSKDDLETRQLRLSELAYGSEKAQELFHDMIQQASYECGFEAQDIPLMIEAIPVSAETLVLIITKVEEPEELDTRFSHFTPDGDTIYDDYEDDYEDDFYEESLPEVSEGNFHASSTQPSDGSEEFVPFSEALSKTSAGNKISEPVSREAFEKAKKANITKIFLFHVLDDLITACTQISGIFQGQSCLYKNPADDSYYFILSKSGLSLEDFNKVCNILSEYGKLCRMTYATLSYMKEHYEQILSENTVARLAGLSAQASI